MCRFAPPDKQRPVLLLTRSDMIPVFATVAAAPLTRTIPGVASEVVVGFDSGLKADSAVNLHHIVTIQKAGLRRFVGTAYPEVLARIRAALLFAFGFE